MRLPVTIFLILLVLGVFQNLAYGPALPDVVASHFDGAGRPNGHQTRAAFRATQLLVLGLIAATLGGSVLLVRSLPVEWVNVPHREHYLAPERRQESLDYLCRWLMWFTDVTLFFILYVFQLTLIANSGGSGRLPNFPMWGGLGLYFVFVAVAMVHMFARFRKPRPAAALA